jgi:hypothetical protein
MACIPVSGFDLLHVSLSNPFFLLLRIRDTKCSIILLHQAVDVFICSLFNNDLEGSGCGLFRHLSGGAEETHKKYQSG